MASQPGEARTGGVRLVLGMVRANRPWWLVTDLSNALAAGLATAAFSVVTTTIWELGDTMGWARLLALGIASVTVLVVWLIVAHDLWEPPADHTEARRVRVANAVTVLTLVIGVTCFYVALFLLVLVSALLVITEPYLQHDLGHPVGLGDYATLAWITASLATIGGALGSGLETDESVRDALYGYRPESLIEQDEESRGDSN
jgi:hypothetical protein